MLSQGLRPVRFVRILIKYKPSDIQTGCLGMSVGLAIIVLRVETVTQLLEALSQIIQPILVESLFCDHLLLGSKPFLDRLVRGRSEIRRAKAASAAVFVLRFGWWLRLEIKALLYRGSRRMLVPLQFWSRPGWILSSRQMCLLLGFVQDLFLFLLL